MNRLLKSTIKFTVGTCVTIGALATAATAVAGSSAAKVMSAGVRAAKSAMKEEAVALKSKTAEPSLAAEEAAMFVDLEEIKQ